MKATLLMSAAIFCLTLPTVAQTYNATSEFSINSGNPNGVWSYGWMPVGFGGLSLLANPLMGLAGSPQWAGWNWDHTPTIWRNAGPTAYGVPTGWLSLHPGPDNEPIVLRWTAPSACFVRVQGQFLGGDSGGMQVAVRLNGQAWWGAVDSGTFSLETDVMAGNTIDFTVYGGYRYGNTPLSAVISVVEPQIAFSPPMLDYGEDQSQLNLQVWNAGGGTLDYTLSGTPNWVSSVNPQSGSSTGSADMQTNTVLIDRSKLALGTNIGSILISSAEAENSPQTVQLRAVSARGALLVGIGPPEAITAGAKWRRLGTTAWQKAGDTEMNIPPGICTIEFKPIAGWNTPGNLGATINKYQTTTAGATYAPLEAQSGIGGTVVAKNAQGVSQGPLAGARVEVAGLGITNTDSLGNYFFGGLGAGTYSVKANKSGYYDSEVRTVMLATKERKQVDFELTAESDSSAPIAFNFTSPDGKHFIERMPGNLNLEIEVGWNGAPGFVRFNINGNWLPARIIGLGGGRAMAILSTPLPAVIAGHTEVTVEVVNGGGQTFYLKPGVHFYPTPGIVVSWYGDVWSWTQVGKRVSYVYDHEMHFIDLKLPVLDWTMHVFGGLRLEAGYDPLAGIFKGSLGGVGKGDVKVPLPDVVFVGDLRIDSAGALAITFTGTDIPSMVPSWIFSARGKAGFGVPVLIVLNGVPGGSVLLKAPIVGDALRIAQIRVFFILGGTVSAEFAEGYFGNCWGTSAFKGAITVGVEGQTLLDFKQMKKLGGVDLEAGIYIGGTGTPELDFCATNWFRSVTLRGYAGVFVTSYMFQWRNELGMEWRFVPNSPQPLQPVSGMVMDPARDAWRPVDNSHLRWGEANSLPCAQAFAGIKALAKEFSATNEEETVVQNVTGLASPSLLTDEASATILYSLQDPEKPWHAATDIGVLTQANNGPWLLDRIQDDLDAEFTPALAAVNSDIFLAAWTRVAGDVSGATNPLQVMPHLEVVTARADRNTKTWSEPLQLTTNDIVDREPLPIVFGANKGILWIQNQADASIGNATNGDRLVYASWNGGGWNAPQTLWSGQKGILNFSFVAASSSEGYVVLASDEDGDLNTRTDRELYVLFTYNGVWQPPVRLTNDGIEDVSPVLVAPNGVPVCVWSTNGSTNATVVYSRLSPWNPKPVYDQYTSANEAATLEGVTLPSGAAIAYTVQETNGVNIVASFYDVARDRWSLPRQLTQDEHAESALSVACDGTSLVIAFLKTQTVRTNMDVVINEQTNHLSNIPQPGRTDLCLLRHTPRYDLAIRPGSFQVAPMNPAPGSTATLQAIVENRGDLPIQGAQVGFYDGDPNSGGKIIGEMQTLPEWLIGGATQEVSASWIVPASTAPHDLYVVVDPMLALDDRDRSNDYGVLRTVLPDLTIETCWSTEVTASEVALVARVVNAGVVPTVPFEVSWRLGVPEGEEIGRSTLGMMSAGQIYEVAFLWDASGRQYGETFLPVYAVADAANLVEELDKSNNTYAQSVRVVPSWIPHMVEVKMYGSEHALLSFESTGFAPSELAVESNASLGGLGQWSEEPSAVITNIGFGRFEALVPVQSNTRFYRIRGAPSP